jgi:DMSO/TMAO reductase YedYZ molybdopterin-dependent catalytic subunit
MNYFKGIPLESRRRFLHRLGFGWIAGAASLPMPGWAGSLNSDEAPAASGESSASWPPPEDPLLAGRPLVRYPEKTDLILLTSRPPQLETPMKYFEHAITSNDAFYVRYHIYPPTEVDLSTWRLKVSGHVEKPLDLSLDDLGSQFTSVQMAAVNQCSGNGRGHFSPRVFGGQWSNGSMGNAEWTVVRLQDVMKAVELKAGAVDVCFNGLDTPPSPTVPDFEKSLAVEHIMSDPDVLISVCDERPATTPAQRLSRAARRSGVVRDLLGEEPVGDYCARPCLRRLLDAKGLPHSRYARWMH